MSALAASGARVVRAPRGSTCSCKGWVQEAALRMLMNNLDPEVAERPDDLVVYGGTGKAARSWEAFDRIVESLRALDQLGQHVGGVAQQADRDRLAFGGVVLQAGQRVVQVRGLLVEVARTQAEIDA